MIPTTEVFAILFALLPACPTEDSANCAWDSSTRGNRRGMSFVSVAMDEDNQLMIYENGTTAVFE